MKQLDYRGYWTTESYKDALLINEVKKLTSKTVEYIDGTVDARMISMNEIYELVSYDIDHHLILMQFTGLTDYKENKIYAGDILRDYTETDEGIIESNKQVFWNQPTASFHLDESREQDMSQSRELWMELNDFDYEIVGNIFENLELIKK